MDLSHLTSSATPWCHLLTGDPDKVRDQLRTLEVPRGHTAVRFVRGRKAVTAAAFFDELGAALQFPDYFGENWDAVNDCLSDLAWLHADSIVLGLLDGDKLLASAENDAAKKLSMVLTAAAGHWNKSKTKPHARSFHVVMQARPAAADAVVRRWAAQGLELKR